MSMISMNGKVACYPFEPEEVLEANKKRLAVAGYGVKPQVTELFVFCGTEVGSDFYVSDEDVILVKASCVNSQWAKEIFTFKGVDDSVEFILVPVSEIVFVDRGAMKGCQCDDICNDCKGGASKTEEPKLEVRVDLGDVAASVCPAKGEVVFPKKSN